MKNYGIFFLKIYNEISRKSRVFLKRCASELAAKLKFWARVILFVENLLQFV